MISFFENYVNNVLELHNEIRGILKEIPHNALDWIPSSGMNSLNVLIVHVTGAERYWIGDVIAGDPSGRDRDAEFEMQGLSANELIQRLDENDNYIQNVLEKLDLEELNKKRTSPRNGREVSVDWALFHALKHTALHVGHIEILRQLWELQKAS